jgi:hypothetical protein
VEISEESVPMKYKLAMRLDAGFCLRNTRETLEDFNTIFPLCTEWFVGNVSGFTAMKIVVFWVAIQCQTLKTEEACSSETSVFACKIHNPHCNPNNQRR